MTFLVTFVFISFHFVFKFFLLLVIPFYLNFTHGILSVHVTFFNIFNVDLSDLIYGNIVRIGII